MFQLHFSFTGRAEYGIGLPASAVINDEGKFVAETPGVFTVIAESGGFSARKTVKVVARNVRKKAIKVGHGTVSNVRTSTSRYGQELVSIREKILP